MVAGFRGEFERYAGGLMDLDSAFLPFFAEKGRWICRVLQQERVSWSGGFSHGSRYPVQTCNLLFQNLARVAEFWEALVMSRG